MPQSDDISAFALAKAYGLEGVRSLDPEFFGKAVAAASALAARISRPASIAEEPAHVCRFPLWPAGDGDTPGESS